MLVLTVNHHFCLIVSDNAFFVRIAVASLLLRTADLATSDLFACFLHVFFGPCADTDLDDNQRSPILMGSNKCGGCGAIG